MIRPSLFQNGSNGASPNGRSPGPEFRTKVKYFLLAVATSLALWVLILAGIWGLIAWIS